VGTSQQDLRLFSTFTPHLGQTGVQSPARDLAFSATTFSSSFLPDLQVVTALGLRILVGGRLVDLQVPLLLVLLEPEADSFLLSLSRSSARCLRRCDS